jgi:hypothetical protein
MALRQALLTGKASCRRQATNGGAVAARKLQASQAAHEHLQLLLDQLTIPSANKHPETLVMVRDNGAPDAALAWSHASPVGWAWAETSQLQARPSPSERTPCSKKAASWGEWHRTLTADSGCHIGGRVIGDDGLLHRRGRANKTLQPAPAQWAARSVRLQLRAAEPLHRNSHTSRLHSSCVLLHRSCH